jgi:hypothetical protein
MVNASGPPVWMRWKPVSVQPLAMTLAKPFVRSNCGFHTHDAATTWRRSRNEGPHSDSRSNGFGILLMRPCVFSGWLVRFFEKTYEPEIEKVLAYRRSRRSCRL